MKPKITPITKTVATDISFLTKRKSNEMKKNLKLIIAAVAFILLFVVAVILYTQL